MGGYVNKVEDVYKGVNMVLPATHCIPAVAFWVI